MLLFVCFLVGWLFVCLIGAVCVLVRWLVVCVSVCSDCPLRYLFVCVRACLFDCLIVVSVPRPCGCLVVVCARSLRVIV